MWICIDSEGAVNDIGKKLMKDYGKDFDTGRKRVIMFLNMTNRKRWRDPQE